MASIAASILAKTHRDEYMLHALRPTRYGWDTNMGYPTVAHRKALVGVRHLCIGPHSGGFTGPNAV